MFNELLFFFHLIMLLALITYATARSLTMLNCCLALNIILANFFVLKQINLFGFTVTATDVFIVSITLGLGIMQKYYGEKAVKAAIQLNLYASLVYLLLSIIHLTYQPALMDTTQLHYQTLLGFMPRIMLASIFVSWCTEQCNRLLVRFFMKKINPASATLMASFIAQTGDTIAFSILGLYGIAHSIIDIIQVSLIIKYILLVIATPVIHWIYRFIKAPYDQI